MTDAQKVVDAVLVRVTDYEGLYIDDTLVDANSNIDLPWSLDGKIIKFTFREGNEADESYVMNVGGFPDTWDELIDHQYMWEEDHRDD